MKHIVCNSYKKELLEGVHSKDHEYYLAFFDDSYIPNDSIKSYKELPNEATGEGYEVGGIKLPQPIISLQEKEAVLTFPQLKIENIAIRARGCIIYNNSLPEKNTISVIDFEEPLIMHFGDLVILFPLQTGLLRIR